MQVIDGQLLASLARAYQLSHEWVGHLLKPWIQ